MNKNRFVKLLAVTSGFVLLVAAPGQARAQSAQPVALQTQAKPQAKSDSLADDFAGLKYTDEQKTEIDKIRQNAAARKEAVSKDAKLSADQKDAMLTGYTRLEYGSIYKVLSPEQRRQVRQKMSARRLSERTAQKKTS